MPNASKHGKTDDLQNNNITTQVCPRCNYKNDQNIIYCVSCGHLLNNIRYCFRCFRYIPAKSRFCPYCGTAIFFLKYCSQCGTQIIGGNFCHKCGFEVRRLNIYSGFYSPIINSSYSTSSINMVFPYSSVERVSEPKWWKSPAFFISMCITGLAPVSYIISVFLLAFLPFFSHTYDQIYFLTYIFGGSLATLLLIYAIFNFPGFRSFWNVTSEPEANHQSVGFYSLDNPQKMNIKMFIPRLPFKVFIWALVFITFFVLLLIVAEDLIFRIITFLKIIIGSSTQTTSSYDIFYQNSEFIILFIFLAVVFAPIHEELLFRGILQQALYKAEIPVWSQYVLQAIAFAYLHLLGDISAGGSWDFILLHMISTGIFALCATWLKRRYKTVIICMIFHSCSNTLEIALPYLTSYIPLNANTDTLDLILIGILLSVALFFFLIAIYFKQIKLSVPKVTFAPIKNKSIIDFIFRFLVIFVFFDISQLILAVLITLNTEPVTLLEVVLGYVLVILGVYLLWGKRIVDNPWRIYFPMTGHEKDSSEKINK